MIKIGIIETYFFKPNYYKYEKQNSYWDCLYIFYNNLYNTKNEIDIINYYDKNNNYNYDIKITNYAITKKIDKDIYYILS